MNGVKNLRLVIPEMEKKKKKPSPQIIEMRKIALRNSGVIHFMRRAPTTRMIRKIVEKVSGSPKRMTPQTLEFLIDHAEDAVVNYLDKANHAAIHSHRVTVGPKDCELVRYISDVKVLGSEQKMINEIKSIKDKGLKHRSLKKEKKMITLGVVKRLARCAGVRRLSSKLIYEVVDFISLRYINILSHAVVFSDYARRKTIVESDVVRALKTMNITHLGSEI
jgi:histone H3/H4